MVRKKRTDKSRDGESSYPQHAGGHGGRGGQQIPLQEATGGSSSRGCGQPMLPQEATFGIKVEVVVKQCRHNKQVEVLAGEVVTIRCRLNKLVVFTKVEEWDGITRVIKEAVEDTVVGVSVVAWHHSIMVIPHEVVIILRAMVVIGEVVA